MQRVLQESHLQPHPRSNERPLPRASWTKTEDYDFHAGFTAIVYWTKRASWLRSSITALRLFGRIKLLPKGLNTATIFMVLQLPTGFASQNCILHQGSLVVCLKLRSTPQTFYLNHTQTIQNQSNKVQGSLRLFHLYLVGGSVASTPPFLETTAPCRIGFPVPASVFASERLRFTSTSVRYFDVWAFTEQAPCDPTSRVSRWRKGPPRARAKSREDGPLKER